MLMTYTSYGEVPAKRHIFYTKAYETMARLHDASKGAYVRPMHTNLSPEDFAVYFAEFCARTYKNEVLEFTTQTFAAYMTESMNHINRGTLKTKAATKDFLLDLTDNLCIMYKEGDKYYFIHRSFQEYFCAVYFSTRMDDKLKKIGDFFESQQTIQYSDKTFDMLNDMIPERLDKYVFLPKLKSLWQQCDSGNGYWTFLEEMYPAIYHQEGNVGDCYETEPESFLYNFIVNETLNRHNGELDDIEPSAVDIAQLRLWLSLVIDDEINPNAQNPLDGHKNPLPLPNLESNILCGNSLSDEFAGIRLINESDIIGTQTDDCQIDFNQPFFEATLKSLVETQNELFSCDTSEKKESLKEKISELRDIIIMKQLEGCSSETLAAYEESKKQASKPYVLWRLDFARVFKMKKGFDIVIGNPPYVDSEEMTKTMPFDRELYVRKFNSTKGNWDLFVPFIENGINLLAKGGTISYIVPNKLISAPYAVEIRKIISTKKVLEIRDYSNVNVFKSAAVYPVVFRVCDTGSKVPVSMNVMLDMTQIQTQNRIDVETFYADVNWDRYFTSKAGALEIIEKLTKFPQLHTLASVNGAATVSEAYLIKEFLIDEQYPLGESKKFINTGGIDPYKSFYGKEYIRYLKGKYMYPIVSCSDLERMSQKRLTESNMPKIIIGGMTKILECYYDKGEYLAGKSTTIVYNYDHLKYILAVLNSKLMTFYYQVFFNSMSLAGGFYRVGAPQVKTLPIAVPSDDLVIKSVEEKVDELQTILESQCEENDRATTLLSDIDSLIYQIYGLNKSEVTVIEEHQS